jgi:hypothetical protein
MSMEKPAGLSSQRLTTLPINFQFIRDTKSLLIMAALSRPNQHTLYNKVFFLIN